MRTLRQGTGEDEQKGGKVEIVQTNEVAGRKHRIEVVASNDVADDDEADQQAETAAPSDDQRHVRTVAGRALVIPVADQQEREDAGQFPEDRQQDEIAGDNHAQHGAHEGEQEGEKAWHRILGGHVVTRVKHHEKADAGDKHREQPGETIHAQRDIQPEFRHPFEVSAHHRSSGDRGIKEAGDGKSKDRYSSRKPSLGIARVGRQHRG